MDSPPPKVRAVEEFVREIEKEKKEVFKKNEVEKEVVVETETETEKEKKVTLGLYTAFVNTVKGNEKEKEGALIDDEQLNSVGEGAGDGDGVEGGGVKVVIHSEDGGIVVIEGGKEIKGEFII